MDLVLGVDGGATKTLLKAKAMYSKYFVSSFSGSSNYKSDGLDIARDNIITGVIDIVLKIKKEFDPGFDSFASSCFGLSGYDFDEDIEAYNDIIFGKKIGKYFKSGKTIICNDTEIGLAAGSDKKNRVIFISGTGSNCYGVNESGQNAKACGWDYILGDQGGGYEIAIKALRAVMKHYDGRGEKTILSDMIFSYLGIKKTPDLFNWVYEKPFSKNKISDLAKLVYRAVELNDKQGKKILKEEIKEIILATSTVIEKLKLDKKDFDLVFTGSTFKDKKLFTDIVASKLRAKYKKINIIYLRKRPVEGAVKIALLNA